MPLQFTCYNVVNRVTYVALNGIDGFYATYSSNQKQKYIRKFSIAILHINVPIAVVKTC